MPDRKLHVTPAMVWMEAETATSSPASREWTLGISFVNLAFMQMASAGIRR